MKQQIIEILVSLKWYFIGWVITGFVTVGFIVGLLLGYFLAEHFAPELTEFVKSLALGLGIVLPLASFIKLMMWADEQESKNPSKNASEKTLKKS